MTYRDPDNARVALDPVLVAFAEESEGADTGGSEELNGQDGVDLANELVSDVDCSLSHGAAKLKDMLVHRIQMAKSKTWC
jgi:hypothetical protein